MNYSLHWEGGLSVLGREDQLKGLKSFSGMSYVSPFALNLRGPVNK